MRERQEGMEGIQSTPGKGYHEGTIPHHKKGLDMKQSDAVFQFITEGKGEGLEGDALTSFAAEKVFAGITDGSINYGKDRADEDGVRSYSKSVTKNSLKKDKRLNGGVDYVPGFRRGPQVKDTTTRQLIADLKALKVLDPDSPHIPTVEAAINARKALAASEKELGALPSMDEVLASIAEAGVDLEGVEG